MTSATDHLRNTLSLRLQSVRRRIVEAARRVQRSPDDITLIAISKTHPTSVLKEALALGITDLGENRIQEAEPKIQEIGGAKVRWHLVGHLQSNKARRAVQLFQVIHSLDSVQLARRLDRVCEEEGRQELDVLIQVDLAGEVTKSGVPQEQLLELAGETNNCQRLKLCGLMVLPPYFERAEDVRPFFVQLRELRDKLQSENYFGAVSGELSMGMTHDFEIAIEEGATMLRVGTAIFGAREARV
jgi:pyridoxal phosphate enzyme (YggS family)